MKKRQIITIIIALIATSAWAQETNNVTLQGSIQDSFLERGLFDCTVTLTEDGLITVHGDDRNGHEVRREMVLKLPGGDLIV